MSEVPQISLGVRARAAELVPFVNLVAQHRSISTEIDEAVQRVFSRQQFILGDEVADFESDFAESCDSRYAVGCASGTDALILSLLALNIGPGDEVITTPFTFFATVSAIRRVGATPVFVDIEPASFNLDSEAVASVVTAKTRAIMPVHLFGQCVEMEPLWRLAVRSGLAIVEDSCQAVGAKFRGRCAGVLGTLGCFSFFPTKNLGGAGDGGLVTADDPELAKRLRRLRVHEATGHYQHSEVGICSRLDALQAAILHVKLAHLADWTIARQQNAKCYGELFRYYQLLDAVELPTVLPDCGHVFNQYCIRVQGGRRDEVLKYLSDRKVGCAVYYPLPLHLQEYFLDLGYSEGNFPEAEAASREVLALPIFPELQAEQQETVVRTIAKSLGRLATQDRLSLKNDWKFHSAMKRAA